MVKDIIYNCMYRIKEKCIFSTLNGTFCSTNMGSKCIHRTEFKQDTSFKAKIRQFHPQATVTLAFQPPVITDESFLMNLYNRGETAELLNYVSQNIQNFIVRFNSIRKCFEIYEVDSNKIDNT